jgi:hypothetical protein
MAAAQEVLAYASARSARSRRLSSRRGPNCEAGISCASISAVGSTAIGRIWRAPPLSASPASTLCSDDHPAITADGVRAACVRHSLHDLVCRDVIIKIGWGPRRRHPAICSRWRSRNCCACTRVAGAHPRARQCALCPVGERRRAKNRLRLAAKLRCE